MKFLEGVSMKIANMEKDEKHLGTKIQEMFAKVGVGDLSGFKSKISSFPREDLSFITGAKMSDIPISIPSLGKTI
jgi:hypothetical protein